MRVVSLGSGSCGNACAVTTEGVTLLVDCGVRYRTLAARAKSVGVDLKSIAAIVFTHDHRDHTQGLDVFRKHLPDVRLFANSLTAEAIAHDSKTGEGDFTTFENGQVFDIGPFSVEPFSIPHDVPDPVGYLVRCADGAYFHATDVGSPLDSIGERLAEADFATLESNHDAVMLRTSNRPEELKRRIRGPRGHLSNDEAASLVRAYASRRLRVLALAHLSEHCNAPHLAEAAMRSALAEIGRADIALTVLERDRAQVIGELTLGYVKLGAARQQQFELGPVGACK